MLAEFVWNPDRNIFIIPYIDHPVTWYGFLFALGFLVGIFLIRKMLADFLDSPATPRSKTEILAAQLTDRGAIFVILGGVIGARLGHVFFYDWPFYRSHPQEIFKIWQGGLASHGGAIGILIALFIMARLARRHFPQLTFLTCLDILVVPTACAGGFIRIGNFINQEITGIPTTVPWGVIFLRPLDGLPGVLVHPVQLYESLFYFLVFAFLLVVWHRDKKSLGAGSLSGWFFLLVFGYRFLIEYLKMPQNERFDVQSWLTMGQLLSVPFALVGLYLLVRGYVYKQAG